MEWGLQNGPITKNIVLSVVTLFLWKFVSVQEPVIKSWFEIPATHMSIFILFSSAGVLFEGAFFPVCILKTLLQVQLETISERICHVFIRCFKVLFLHVH